MLKATFTIGWKSCFCLYSDFISLRTDMCHIYGSTSQQYDQLEKEKKKNPKQANKQTKLQMMK